MVEPASAAAAAKAWDIGFLGLSELVKRIDLVEDNKKKLPELSNMYDNVLKEVDDLVEHDVFHDIALCNQNVKRRLQEYKERLQNNRDKIKALENEVKSTKFWEFWKRVQKPRKVMEECRAVATDFRGYYDASVRPSLEKTAEAKAARERTNLERAQERTAVVISSEPDSYVVRSNVPPNPPRLTLDYTKENTCEGRLKAEVLRSLQSSSRIVGVVALGLGGVGKTCALRGLADDKEIRETFPGGILYIELGNDSRLPDVISGIANSVERTGGKQVARTIRVLRTVEEASEKAGQWFEGHKCLFLVDDVWEVNGITPYELRKLGSMLNDESLLVYTSRAKGFVEGADKTVPFEEREAHGELAQRMLMNHAEFGSYSELRSANREAVKGILEICQGLPLALGIAGATVKCYFEEGVNKQDAWSEYYHDLNSNEESIVAGSTGLYGPLRLIVDRSLKVLDSESRSVKVLESNSSCKKSFEEMFRGLCVFQKQQSVGGQVLQKLWNLEGMRSTQRIAGLFDSVSLIRMVRRRGNQFSVRVRDLVIDIANEMSSCNEKTGWFKTLLDNYIAKERSTTPAAEINAARSEEEKVLFTPWWGVADDGFIHDNLCQLLQGAGAKKELLWLLERARWVVMRLQKVGISGVEQDLAIGRKVSEKDKSNETGIGRYLKLVGSAARMSFAAVNENAYEAWFQLYGRPDGPDRCTGEVQRVAYCGSGSKVVSGCGDGCVRLWDAESGDRIGQPLAAHTGKVKCVAVSADANRIVSASDDGTVRVWDANSGDAVAKLLAGGGIFGAVAVNDDGMQVVFSFEERVHVWDVDSRGVTTATRDAWVYACVAMSADSSRIAFSSSREGMTVWDVQRRKTVRSFLETNMGSIRSITFSGDGKRMVSGSRGGTVRVWDVASGGAVGDPFVHDYKVFHVRSEVHGSRVISHDEQGYGRLWDVARGQCMMTSSEAEWTATLHRFGPARFCWDRWHREDVIRTRRSVGDSKVENEQLLASADSLFFRVGDMYFSQRHGATLWPFCRIIE